MRTLSSVFNVAHLVVSIVECRILLHTFHHWTFVSVVHVTRLHSYFYVHGIVVGFNEIG